MSPAKRTPVESSSASDSTGLGPPVLRLMDGERTMNETTGRILDAAAQLFYEQGYHATTVRQISGLVGIKAGSLYNHYGSKQEILFLIAHGTMQELIEGSEAALAKQSTPEGRLRAFIAWHVEYHAVQQLRAKVADDQLHALDDDRRQRVLALRDQYEAMLKRLLEDGKKRAGWQVPDISVVAFAIGTMCSAVNVWYRPGGRLAPARIAEVYADLIVSGLDQRS